MGVREYLEPGTVLAHNSREYRIDAVRGRGSSCVVYSVTYSDSYDVVVRRNALLKECLPYNIRLKRQSDLSLSVPDGESEEFNRYKKRFEDAYYINLKLLNNEDIGNSSSFVIDFFEKNNTLYALYSIDYGRTYDEYYGESLLDVLKTGKAASDLLLKYHNNGYLYLDLKPENMLILPETREHIVLFDFDSVIKLDEFYKRDAIALYSTNRYAAPELNGGNKSKIGAWSDIYSLGVIIFEKLFGRRFEGADLWKLGRLDLSKLMADNAGIRPEFFSRLQFFLKKTLISAVRSRFQTMSEVSEFLGELIALCNNDEPFAISNMVYGSKGFTGRKNCIDEIDDVLKSSNTVLLYGMGGEGKTALVKYYAYTHSNVYDRIIYLSCAYGIQKTVALDVMVRHLRYGDDESIESLYQRKMQILKNDLTDRDLIILDDYSPEGEYDDNTELERLLEFHGKYIIVSRTDMSDCYPACFIDSLSPEECLEVFNMYYGKSYKENRRRGIEQILEKIGCHALLTELIAKYMARSRCDPGKIINMLESDEGLFGLTDARVAVRKDRTYRKDTIGCHIKRLFKGVEFSAAQVSIMHSLSLLGPVWISIELFNGWMGGAGYELINDLIDAGWIKQENDRISLHQMIMDLMYRDMRDSGDSCETLLRSLTGYIEAGHYINRFDRIASEKLAETVKRRITGESRVCFEYLTVYYDRVEESDPLLRTILSKAEENGWTDIMGKAYGYSALSDLNRIFRYEKGRSDPGFDRLDKAQKNAFTDNILRNCEKSVKCINGVTDPGGYISYVVRFEGRLFGCFPDEFDIYASERDTFEDWQTRRVMEYCENLLIDAKRLCLENDLKDGLGAVCQRLAELYDPGGYFKRVYQVTFSDVKKYSENYKLDPSRPRVIIDGVEVEYDDPIDLEFYSNYDHIDAEDYNVYENNTDHMHRYPDAAESEAAGEDNAYEDCFKSFKQKSREERMRFLADTAEYYKDRSILDLFEYVSDLFNYAGDRKAAAYCIMKACIVYLGDHAGESHGINSNAADMWDMDASDTVNRFVVSLSYPAELKKTEKLYDLLDRLEELLDKEADRDLISICKDKKKRLEIEGLPIIFR